MTEFDGLADRYDATRGGEARGDEYAADIAAVLPPDEGTILEIGVGTGVVALGLRRHGRSVVGLDLSQPMLDRARTRLGESLVLSDALEMSVATGSVAHAVSVWVVHSVADPVRLFKEAARVLRPGGLYVVCNTQRPAPDDEVGRVVTEAAERVDLLRGAASPRGVTTAEILGWAARAGFVGTVHGFERQWRSSPADELFVIRSRSSPAMRDLGAATFAEATRPAVEALEAMPDGECTRRATADMIVLHKGDSSAKLRLTSGKEVLRRHE